MDRYRGVVFPIHLRSCLQRICLLLVLIGLAAGNAFSGESKYNPNAKPREYIMYCWAIMPDYTVYITQIVRYPMAANPNNADQHFNNFMASKYGVKVNSRCSVLPDKTVEKFRQAEMDRLLRGSPKIRFVNVDWVPPSTPPAVVAAPKPTAVPTAPALTPMQQYEQAMMAQKPKSVSGAALQQAMKAADTAASPPSVKPPSAPTETYAYCVGRGSPRDGAPGHTTHYISTLFPATPDARPTALFTTYLSHAHPQELIRGISAPGRRRWACRNRGANRL